MWLSQSFCYAAPDILSALESCILHRDLPGLSFENTACAVGVSILPAGIYIQPSLIFIAPQGIAVQILSVCYWLALVHNGAR